MSLKLVFISDTHNKHKKLTIPECDILFHSGDWTSLGNKHEVEAFAKWLEKQPAKHIVITPGNHECSVERHLPESREWITNHCPRAKVLIHEACEVEGIKVFGSPYTPAFGRGWAWNAGRDVVESAHIFKPFIGDKWKDIPQDTQILLTHGPAKNILDTVANYHTGRLESVGCWELYKRIVELPDLKIHSSGHLHFDGAKMMKRNGVTFINAAMCDDQYVLDRQPVVIGYDKS